MFLTQDLSLLFLVPSEREKTRDLFPSLKKKINWNLGMKYRKIHLLLFFKQVCIFGNVTLYIFCA